ncbi:hypothetical protein ACHAXS_010202 [Conticribra weissflogii]
MNMTLPNCSVEWTKNSYHIKSIVPYEWNLSSTLYDDMGLYCTSHIMIYRGQGMSGISLLSNISDTNVTSWRSHTVVILLFSNEIPVE